MNGKKCYPGQQAEMLRCNPPEETVTTSNTTTSSGPNDDPNGQYYKCVSPDYFGC